jgi:hypothetical protein
MRSAAISIAAYAALIAFFIAAVSIPLDLGVTQIAAWLEVR